MGTGLQTDVQLRSGQNLDSHYGPNPSRPFRTRRVTAMRDDEAAKELSNRGCNYITFCVDLNYLERHKNDLQTKYMIQLETHYTPAEFEGRAGYLLGVIIPHQLIHPPTNRIQ
jgi:hypothetical protein